MKLTGGEIVARALADEGVRYAFGIPGTHNIELYDALGESAMVRPVLVTDEQSASFMADLRISPLHPEFHLPLSVSSAPVSHDLSRLSQGAFTHDLQSRLHALYAQ